MKYKILFIFALISLINSIALSAIPVDKTCAISSCETVHTSVYNFTFGIQNSYFGVAIFLILSILIYSQIKNPTKEKRNYIHFAIILGSIISIYFIYIQQFVIKNYCRFCLVIDISLIISLIVILSNWEK